MTTCVQRGKIGAEFLENLSKELACRLTHPPSHISFNHFAITMHCSALSSPLMGGTRRIGEASTYLAKGEIDVQINPYIQSFLCESKDMQWKTASGKLNFINTVNGKTEIDFLKLFQKILVLLAEQTNNKASYPNFEFCSDTTLLIAMRQNNALNVGNDIDSSDQAVSAKQLLGSASQPNIRRIIGICDEVVDVQSTS